MTSSSKLLWAADLFRQSSTLSIFRACTMAIIEEVSDDERDEKAVQDDDLLIEELPDEPHDAPSVPTQVTTPVGSPSSASSPSELGHVLRQLSLKLVLPEELLPSFMGEDKRTQSAECR